MTAIATSQENPDLLLTASRDKTIIVWQLSRDDTNYGYPKKILHGHNHFVSDVVISSDGQFALSSSWDKTLRLWDLNTGETTRRFVGHTGDVLSVSFSPDNRQIVSGSRDRTIKLWNTLGDCKFNIQDDGHTEWVSCVRFSPNPQNPVIVSAGWDKVVKVRTAARQVLGRRCGCTRKSKPIFATIEWPRSRVAMRRILTTKITESSLDDARGRALTCAALLGTVLTSRCGS